MQWTFFQQDSGLIQPETWTPDTGISKTNTQNLRHPRLIHGLEELSLFVHQHNQKFLD